MEAVKNSPMLISQRIVQILLFIVAAIALMGGITQISLGEPETTPRLDNVHRFLAGVYLGCGFIVSWAALTVRKQGTLIYLIALTVFLAGTGRLISISTVGMPEPASVWIGYLIPELSFPVIMVVLHWTTMRTKK